LLKVGLKRNFGGKTYIWAAVLNEHIIIHSNGKKHHIAKRTTTIPIRKFLKCDPVSFDNNAYSLAADILTNKSPNTIVIIRSIKPIVDAYPSLKKRKAFS